MDVIVTDTSLPLCKWISIAVLIEEKLNTIEAKRQYLPFNLPKQDLVDRDIVA